MEGTRKTRRGSQSCGAMLGVVGGVEVRRECPADQCVHAYENRGCGVVVGGLKRDRPFGPRPVPRETV